MTTRILALTALAAFCLAPAFGQDSTPASQPAAQQTQSAPSNQAPAASTDQQPQAAPSNSAPATTADNSQAHQPLQLEQHEGFWGKLNPFARKKYVRRQLQPVVGRVNELDELTAANAKDIKDVDSRAQQGIQMASAKASEADQHAVAAAQQAEQANQTAQQASTRLTSVSTAVSSLDEYKPVTDVEIHFRPGQTVLTKKAKDALDQLAGQMKDQHGTIVQVQGFSSGSRQAAISNSQAMAEAVVRYMVLNHDIPMWRIYTVGMGNAPISVEGKAKRIHGGRVDVALLKNGVADLASAAPAASNQAAPAGSPAGAAPSTTQGMSGTATEAAPSGAPAPAATPATPSSNTQPAQQQPPAPENPKK